MAKRKRRKATLHSAGKVQEADLLARARALRDDPSLAAPVCEGGCVLFSPVAAARKGIAKAHAARDDAGKLQRLASSGNELARAYAATLLLAKEDKVPYVAELRLGGLTAPYVIRGKAKPFYLAGLQNYEDRQLRLLSYSKWVKKRGLHFWSADRGVVCTGKRNAPPRDFVEEEAEALGLDEKEPGRFVCEHGGAGDDREAIVLDWTAANARLERCSRCFDDVPTLAAIARHMAIPSAFRSFDVKVALPQIRTVKGEPVASDVRPPEAALAAYRTGAKDADLVEEARLALAAQLRQREGLLLVAGDASYGSDVGAFLDALAAGPAERRAVQAALSTRAKPVVLDRASIARAVAELWSDHALQMLEAAAGDAAVAQRLHKAQVAPDEAVELLRRAEREGVHRAATAALPRYQVLPPAAAVADAIARAYRAGGADLAARAALERSAGGKTKGVVLAFLQALGGAKGQEWRFARTDHEAAAALAPSVERLLRGDPASYHEALREASLLAGETTPFEPQR